MQEQSSFGGSNFKCHLDWLLRSKKQRLTGRLRHGQTSSRFHGTASELTAIGQTLQERLVCRLFRILQRLLALLLLSRFLFRFLSSELGLLIHLRP